MRTRCGHSQQQQAPSPPLTSLDFNGFGSADNLSPFSLGSRSNAVISSAPASPTRPLNSPGSLNCTRDAHGNKQLFHHFHLGHLQAPVLSDSRQPPRQTATGRSSTQTSMNDILSCYASSTSDSVTQPGSAPRPAPDGTSRITLETQPDNTYSRPTRLPDQLILKPRFLLKNGKRG